MTRKLIDENGENLAVRAFLTLYGAGNILTAKQMMEHLERSGFPYWPKWVPKHQPESYLTKFTAAEWLRYLFALEKTHGH